MIRPYKATDETGVLYRHCTVHTSFSLDLKYFEGNTGIRDDPSLTVFEPPGGKSYLTIQR